MVYEWDEKDEDEDKDNDDNVDYNDTDKDDEDKDHKDKDDLDDTCFTCSCTGGLAGQSWAEVLVVFDKYDILVFWQIWNPDVLANMKSDIGHYMKSWCLKIWNKKSLFSTYIKSDVGQIGIPDVWQIWK